MFKPGRDPAGHWGIVNDDDGEFIDDTVYPNRAAAQTACDGYNFVEHGFDEFRAAELRYDGACG